MFPAPRRRCLPGGRKSCGGCHAAAGILGRTPRRGGVDLEVLTHCGIPLRRLKALRVLRRQVPGVVVQNTGQVNLG